MNLLTRPIAILLAIGATALLAGCASTKSTPTADAAGAGVMCNLCKTTYTVTPVTVGGNPHDQAIRVVGERKVGTHQCPECKQVATEFLTSGKAMTPGAIIHTCKMCGGEMKACKAAG